VGELVELGRHAGPLLGIGQRLARGVDDRPLAGQRGVELEEVLLLGRLDAGGTEFKPVPLDFGALCRRVAEEMETATQRRCPIQCRIAEGTTGAWGDEAALRHILTNLLSNAVKYSAPGEPVVVELGRAGGEAVLAIRDRGCGIPAADQPRLFQAFHRGANVRQIPGTGLGLRMVQAIVSHHHGTFGLSSQEGVGTTATMRLPLQRVNGTALRPV